MVDKYIMPRYLLIIKTARGAEGDEKMKLTSKRDAKTLEALTAGLDNPSREGGRSHRRFSSDGWATLIVERIGDRLFSLAHYVEQHGDACRDPEQTFYRADADTWAACSFRNDLVHVNSDAVVFSHDGGTETITGFRPAAQRDAASFAALWLRNIRQQGFLAAKPATVATVAA